MTSSIQDILIARGIAKDSAVNMAKALKQTTSQLAEQENYAQILPVSALHELEASWKRGNKHLDDSKLDSQVIVIDPYAIKTLFRGNHGDSLLDLAKQDRESVLNEHLEFSCGGNMTCASCHVYVLQGYKPPCEEEQDMIDLAWEPKDGTSRLGCQVCLDRDTKLVVQIPAKAFNHFK